MRLGANRAFGPAAALLAHFTGVAMSPATLRRRTEPAGATMRQLTLAEAAAAQAAVAPAAATPAGPLQLRVDGSLIPLVDEGWREIKLAAVGERSATGLTALSYAATLGGAATFGVETVGELVRRGVCGECAQGDRPGAAQRAGHAMVSARGRGAARPARERGQRPGDGHVGPGRHPPTGGAAFPHRRPPPRAPSAATLPQAGGGRHTDRRSPLASPLPPQLTTLPPQNLTRTR